MQIETLIQLGFNIITNHRERRKVLQQVKDADCRQEVLYLYPVLLVHNSGIKEIWGCESSRNTKAHLVYRPERRD